MTQVQRNEVKVIQARHYSINVSNSVKKPALGVLLIKQPEL